MIDFTKPVQTRDGRKVRVLCTDKKGNEYPVVVLRESSSNDGRECLDQYRIDGSQYIDGTRGNADLINVPVKHKWWVNVYPDMVVSNGYETRKSADVGADASRIACIEIEFTEGEGL